MMIQIYGFMMTCFSVREVSKNFFNLVLPEAILIQIYCFMLTCFSVREVSKYLFIWYYLRQCWSRSMASCWLGFQWGRYPNIYSFGITWGNVDPDLWLHADLVFSEGGIQIFIHLVLPEAMLIQIYGFMLTCFSVSEVFKYLFIWCYLRQWWSKSMASWWLVFQWGRYPNIFLIWCYLRQYWSRSIASCWLVFQWGRYPNIYSFGITWGNVDPDLWLHADLVFNEGGIQIFIHLVLPEAMLIQIYGFMLTWFSVREVYKYLFIWCYLRQCWSRSMASCWLAFQWVRYSNIYSFGVTCGNVDPDLWLDADFVFSERGIQIFIHLVLLFKHRSSKCSLHLSVLSTQMLCFHWTLYSNHQQQSLSSCNGWNESKSQY